MAPDDPDRLTPRQRQVLAFVRDCTARQGAPPTVREIAAGLGFASTNAVAGHLDALARAGVLSRSPRRSRGLRVTGAEAAGSIPILGRIAAGRPILAVENREGQVAPDAFLGTEPDFALRVQGDSMTGDGILPGDLIFVRNQPVARRGEIVVALLDDEATVKRFQPDPDGLRATLVASNPAYPPIPVDLSDDRFRILGVVVGVFRKV
ncbi:MAG TPA: transcriptional repressor LexA [Myxococcota bacterium]|nr:transcriptional repressor LexA [Myxococcota bacterium]